jgi:type VI secretion system secreted protein VgrG
MGASSTKKLLSDEYLILLVTSKPSSNSNTARSSEIFTDALGRIRIQFDFQKAGNQGPDTSNSSTWVRVMQRWANSNQTGWQFIPRTGQEVLVGFFDGDIERPYVMGALYNGQGEASPAPTPGGKDLGADAPEMQNKFRN